MQEQMPVMYAEVIEDLSKQRVKTYRTKLTTAQHGLPNADVVKAYFLLNDISQHLFMPMQLVEVVLRNRLCAHIQTLTGKADWYLTIPITKGSKDQVSNAIQQTIRERKLNNQAQVTPDDVICRLTFGFWVRLLEPAYRDTARPKHLLWDQHSFRKVFPGAPKGVKIGNVSSQLLALNTLRNRLFHHEPMWSPKKVTSLTQAITEVENQYKVILGVLGWLSPEKLELLKAWSFHGRLAKAADSTRFDRALW